MSLLSQRVAENISKGSWIRRMFEAGIVLKQQHGADAVCDFSLGNPDLPPPPAVAAGLRALADKADRPFALGYMPNGGFAWAREMLAAHLSHEQCVDLTADDVLLTCGAAGGLNAFFRAVLDPGDEVLALAPCFVEYGGYVDNHGGIFRTVKTREGSFAPDPEALAAAVTPRTRALIVNSPNNPTGQIYSRVEMENIIAVLDEAGRGRERPIFLVADEPYRFLAYDDAEVPALLPMYPYAVAASSFSKNLSIPGERVGYLALSPLMPERASLMAGLLLANRILGFVNPPVVGQHIMAAALASSVDVSIYARRRDAMAAVLNEAGYEFAMPKGAFYFFPKAPGGDDVAFVDKLMENLILAVPGSGFCGPGYFRLAFCVGEEIIRRALPGLKKARG